MRDSKAREQFEAWAKEYGMLLAHDKADVALTWAAWQASRAAALEEAARAMHPELRSMLSRGEAAAAIRALAGRGA